MPIAPFPHTYIVDLQHGALVAAQRSDVPIGAPPQFGGSDRVWSPEELLLGATLSCLQTTFEAYAKASGLAVSGFDGTARAQLVKGSGGPVFTSIELAVTLQVATTDAPRAEQILRKAEANCIISRALAVPVHLSVQVDEVAPAA
jgi:osmotically inducible protein OsmC